MEASKRTVDWANAICLASDSLCPADLLEEVMSAPECAPFGPVHHYLVGVTLLTCARNAMGTEALPAQLAELERRSNAVPGGVCAHWGICGAAISSGMALSILLGNAPLKPEGWSDAQLMVADIAEKIAKAGAPRCCKRDSRIAVRVATGWFSTGSSAQTWCCRTAIPHAECLRETRSASRPGARITDPARSRHELRAEEARLFRHGEYSRHVTKRWRGAPAGAPPVVHARKPLQSHVGGRRMLLAEKLDRVHRAVTVQPLRRLRAQVAHQPHGVGADSEGRELCPDGVEQALRMRCAVPHPQIPFRECCRLALIMPFGHVRYRHVLQIAASRERSVRCTQKPRVRLATREPCVNPRGSPATAASMIRRLVWFASSSPRLDLLTRGMRAGESSSMSQSPPQDSRMTRS